MKKQIVTSLVGIIGICLWPELVAASGCSESRSIEERDVEFSTSFENGKLLLDLTVRQSPAPPSEQLLGLVFRSFPSTAVLAVVTDDAIAPAYQGWITTVLNPANQIPTRLPMALSLQLDLPEAAQGDSEIEFSWLSIPAPPPGGEARREDADAKVTICHLPPGNTANAQTIEVGPSAVDDHLAHGDLVGACPTQTPGVRLRVGPGFNAGIDQAPNATGTRWCITCRSPEGGTCSACVTCGSSVRACGFCLGGGCGIYCCGDRPREL